MTLCVYVPFDNFFIFQEMERQRSLELENHSEEVQKLVTANSKLHGRCRELANGEKVQLFVFVKVLYYQHPGTAEYFNSGRLRGIVSP